MDPRKNAVSAVPMRAEAIIGRLLSVPNRVTPACLSAAMV
jgi:hypothetical protein